MSAFKGQGAARAAAGALALIYCLITGSLNALAVRARPLPHPQVVGQSKSAWEPILSEKLLCMEVPLPENCVLHLVRICGQWQGQLQATQFGVASEEHAGASEELPILLSSPLVAISPAIP